MLPDCPPTHTQNAFENWFRQKRAAERKKGIPASNFAEAAQDLAYHGRRFRKVLFVEGVKTYRQIAALLHH